jgi:hypothetical protein
MNKSINQFGETVYKWNNHIHPDNPNFQQVVFWSAWKKPDGCYSIGYSLGTLSKFKMIEWGKGDILKAIAKYMITNN